MECQAPDSFKQLPGIWDPQKRPEQAAVNKFVALIESGNYEVHNYQYLLDNGLDINATHVTRCGSLRNQRRLISLAFDTDNVALVIWMISKGAQLDHPSTIQNRDQIAKQPLAFQLIQRNYSEDFWRYLEYHGLNIHAIQKQSCTSSFGKEKKISLLEFTAVQFGNGDKLDFLLRLDSDLSKWIPEEVPSIFYNKSFRPLLDRIFDYCSQRPQFINRLKMLAIAKEKPSRAQWMRYRAIVTRAMWVKGEASHCLLELSSTNFIRQRYFNALLAHRFGTPLESACGAIRYEGFYIDEEPIFDLKRLMKTKAYRKQIPYEVQQRLNRLFDSLNSDGRSDPQKVFDHWKSSGIAAAKCSWPGHTAYLLLYHNKLIMCNRGADNPKGMCGWSTFHITPKALTKARLERILSDPSYTREAEGQRTVGINLAPSQSRFLKPQTGGFCSWQNLKCLMKLLFVVDAAGARPTKDVVSLIEAGMDLGLERYKRWSQFDRHRSIRTTLDHYTTHPNTPVDRDLLLFILPRIEDKKLAQRLGRFLRERGIPKPWQLHFDRYGFGPLSRAKDAAGVQRLTNILASEWNMPVSEVWRHLDAARIRSGGSLALAIKRCKWSAAQQMISLGIKLGDKGRSNALRQLVQHDQQRLLKLVNKAGTPLTIEGTAIETLAKRYKAQKCLKYLNSIQDGG